MHDQLALTFACPEPKGTVLRTVRPLRPLTEELLYVYDRLLSCRNLFGVCDLQTLEDLAIRCRDFWLVEGVGLLCFSMLTSNTAHVHITFWDRRLRGREGLCKALAGYIMDREGVETILTAIPPDSRTVLAFAKRVGFKPTATCNGRVVLSADRFTMNHPGV